MAAPLSLIDWKHTNEKIKYVLNHEEQLSIHTLDQGYEAEVIKLCLNEESYVLKTWNKHSQPDVGFQYQLLNALSDQGISVTQPLSWGKNSNDQSVLLTTFDGFPVMKVNKKKMNDIAKLLSTIHLTSLQKLHHIKLPTYEFINYFYAGVREQPDLYQALGDLVSKTEIKQEQLIHGDFHLGNILEENEMYTVIDWTNGQLGDARYDFAWSLILKKIYISERHALNFRTAYLKDMDMEPEDILLFEAIASLRWILYYRNGNVPVRANTVENATRLIASNHYLKELELLSSS